MNRGKYNAHIEDKGNELHKAKESAENEAVENVY
jgi:hypothetical protein